MSVMALEAMGLAKSFGGLCAASKVSFSVPDGSLTALIGPNGAGKTTIFNLVTNLYEPDSGEVRFYGASLAGLSSAEIAALGLVRTFQAARIFPGMTTLENALVGAHLRIRAQPWRQMLWTPTARREERAIARRADALLDLVGLSRFRDCAATELAMGAQKLLEVIRALMAQPRMVLLDEPAAGLNDAETSELAAVLRAVCSSGVTVMVVEHNMSLVMGIADLVIVLDAGAIVASGTPSEIQRDKHVIEAYVGQESG
jgi:branched-chain amino acid transport system ATP-binding protein